MITNALASSTSTLTISNTVGLGYQPTANGGNYPYMTASLREGVGAKLALVKNGTAASPIFINSGSYSGGTVVNAGSLTGFQGTAFGVGDVTANGGRFVVDFNAFATGSGSQNLADSVAGGLILAGGSASFLGRPNGAAATFTASNTVVGGGNPANGRFWTVSGTTTAGMAVGQPISGANAPAGTYISAIIDSTRFMINQTLGSGSTNASYTLAATTNTSSQTYGGGQVSADSTLTVDDNGGSGMTLTLGSLSGTGGLTKAGSGRFVVNGANNSYAGTIKSAGGTIALGQNTSLASAVIDTSGTGVYDVTSATNPTFGGLIDGSGARNLSAVLATSYSSLTGVTLTVAAGNSLSYAGVIADGAAGMSLTKLGSGTQSLVGASVYSGPTTAGAGVLRFDSVAASSAAQSLGAGAVVNLGVASTTAGEIDYFGAGGTLDKNVFAVGSGRNRIRNSGAGTLALSGTLTKDGTILELAGGTFNVTGRITGGSDNSDLFVNGATVTLSNTNNDYNGPTYVYGDGVVLLGASDVIPAGSVVTLGGTGGDIGTGTLNLGSFSDAVGGLSFGSGGGTLRLTASATGATAQLTAATGTMALTGGQLDLTGSGTTAGLYRVLSAQSITGAFSGTTGLNAAYQLLSTGSTVNLQQRAVFGGVSVTNTTAAIITGGSAAFTYSVTNAAASGGASLSFTGTGLSNVDGASLGTASGAGESGAIAGLVFTGTGVGLGQIGTFMVSDSSAYGGTSLTGTVSLNVLNHSLASFAATDTATKTLDFGDYDNGVWTGGDGGDGTLGYSLFNIASLGFSDAETAGLNLYDVVFMSGDDIFDLGYSTFQNLASGSSSGFSASVLSPQTLGGGSYTATYTLRFRDQQNLSGAANTRDLNLTLSANVIVVPEPGAVALAAVGIAAAATILRRRR